MSKELENAGTWIKKHQKWLIVVLFIFLLVGSPIGLTVVEQMGIVNPGFPGAESACQGVQFNGYSGWTGNGVYYNASDAQTTDLVSHGVIGMGDHVYWGSVGPESMTVAHRYDTVGGSNTQQLSTEVQTNIPLANFNYQTSTPLLINNALNWDQGEILQYWNVQASGSQTVTLSNGTQVNQTTYTATSQSLLLIPGNFYLSVYIPPSRDNAGTSSGWQEGTWSNVDFWYVIYWYEWLNAFGNVLQSNEVPPNIPANALNRQSQFNLRGGFPIMGWIQGYTIPYPTISGGTINDAVSLTPASGTTQGLPISASTKQNILGQISLNPSLTGRTVTLYTSPGGSYKLPTYTLPSGSIDTDPNFASSQGLSQSPDFQTTLPAEYFKISVNTLGTTLEGTLWGGWTVYYPTVDYLLRFIFGVYGVHTYIWTVQTALNLGYNATSNYQAPPANWENRTITTTTGAGPISGFADWFSNPWNSLQFYLMVFVIVILIITVLNPGIWTVILHKRKED